jgi:hypothetical protein
MTAILKAQACGAITLGSRNVLAAAVKNAVSLFTAKV